MKILNAFCGVGGNRTLWGYKHDITNLDTDLGVLNYLKTRFPNDKYIQADAMDYILQHYNEYDFIWASPPCQSHSRNRTTGCPKYADMSLYQLILFLSKNKVKKFKGIFVIENVIPYYKFLINPTVIYGRHAFWSNINLPKSLAYRVFEGICVNKNETSKLKIFHNIDLKGYKGNIKREFTLHNCVDYELAHNILKIVETNYFNKNNKLL